MERKTVPVEPTEEMVRAGYVNGSRWLPLHEARKAVRVIYKAMLAAAPCPDLSELLALATRIFAQGYMHGHNDTVESCFTDVKPQDEADYFAGLVSDISAYRELEAAWCSETETEQGAA